MASKVFNFGSLINDLHQLDFKWIGRVAFMGPNSPLGQYL
jgi:hypothetical protein